MSFAGKILRGALLHTRSAGLVFPGAASRIVARPITTSNFLRSDDTALTENEEKRVAIIGNLQSYYVLMLFPFIILKGSNLSICVHRRCPGGHNPSDWRSRAAHETPPRAHLHPRKERHAEWDQ